MTKKLLILTSGGDAPGMNAALRACVRTALHYNMQVYGSHMGYAGLIENQIERLDITSVANVIQRGGTVLKTGRCPRFRHKESRDIAREYLNKLGIDGIIVLGGDGSFRGAKLMNDEGGPPVIGVPCTIDNDISGTDYCIGFDTARNTALEAIDKIRDTAFSLDRNFIIEVMGRASGFLAVDVGIAGGAEVILTPEFPFTTEQLIAKIQKKRRTKMASIIVAAEANKPGYTLQLADEIEQLSGINYKVCILGHMQRGGSPSAQDRKMASMMGARAVDALNAGETQHMVALQNGEIVTTEFPHPDHATRFFSDKALLELNDIICGI